MIQWNCAGWERQLLRVQVWITHPTLWESLVSRSSRDANFSSSVACIPLSVCLVFFFSFFFFTRVLCDSVAYPRLAYATEALSDMINFSFKVGVRRSLSCRPFCYEEVPTAKRHTRLPTVAETRYLPTNKHTHTHKQVHTQTKSMDIKKDTDVLLQHTQEKTT